jgi:hypothetical protein
MMLLTVTNNDERRGNDHSERRLEACPGRASTARITSPGGRDHLRTAIASLDSQHNRVIHVRHRRVCSGTTNQHISSACVAKRSAASALSWFEYAHEVVSGVAFRIRTGAIHPDPACARRSVQLVAPYHLGQLRRLHLCRPARCATTARSFLGLDTCISVPCSRHDAARRQTTSMTASELIPLVASAGV